MAIDRIRPIPSDGNVRHKGKSRKCTVPECALQAHSLGWCRSHYGKWLRYGDPTKTRADRQTKVRKFLEEVLLPYTGDECLEWPFALRVRVAGVNQIPSRFVCEKAHGAPPSQEHEAAHSCGNGHLNCVTPSHLRWATRIENTMDKVVHGSTKLNPDKVKEIRRLLGEEGHPAIAARYGVDASLISLIATKKRWAWVN